MIYFDENNEAYAQLETLKKWGKTLVYQCSESVHQEFLENKRIWSNNNKLILNPNYEQEQAQKEKEAQNIELQRQIDALELKRTRALAEPGIKDEITGQTWLQYRTEQITELREQMNKV